MTVKMTTLTKTETGRAVTTRGTLKPSESVSASRKTYICANACADICMVLTKSTFKKVIPHKAFRKLNGAC